MEKSSLIDYLCRDLKLTIQREPKPLEPGKEQIRVTLRDEQREVWGCYEINESKANATLEGRKYYLREAVIMSIRRIVAEAIGKGLIKDMPTPNSGSLGVWTSSSTTPATAKDESTTLTTSLDAFE